MDVRLVSCGRCGLADAAANKAQDAAETALKVAIDALQEWRARTGRELESGIAGELKTDGSATR